MMTKQCVQPTFKKFYLYFTRIIDLETFIKLCWHYLQINANVMIYFIMQVINLKMDQKCAYMPKFHVLKMDVDCFYVTHFMNNIHI